MTDKIKSMDRELYRTVMGTPPDEMEKEREKEKRKKANKLIRIKQLRKELDIARNALKKCLLNTYCNCTFQHKIEIFIDLIDEEHNSCNKQIGELTE